LAHEEVAQVDPDRAVGTVRVRVDVVPIERDVVGAPHRDRAIRPVCAGLEADVVRFDPDVARAFPDGDPVCVHAFDGDMPDGHVLRRDDVRKLSDLDPLPLPCAGQVHDLDVFDDHVAVRPLDPNHPMRDGILIPVERPVADHERVGTATRPVAHPVHQREVRIVSDVNRFARLEPSGVRQPIARRGPHVGDPRPSGGRLPCG
jgi:hypothetical protein